MWPYFLTAFTLGLAGSLHCVGMCGPLALAMPLQGMSRSGQVFGILLYHTGRVMTYSIGGLVFGLLGRRVYLAGWQQGFSMTLGVIVLAVLAWGRLGGSIRGRPGGRTMTGHGSVPWRGHLWRLIGQLWQSSSRSRFLLLGMANGLLPCGMVYIAIAGALTSSGAGQAAGFMAAFGAGTLPLMLVVHYSGRALSLSVRRYYRRMAPLLIASMGVLLILRGLNLGIPFISPVLATGAGQVIGCH